MNSMVLHKVERNLYRLICIATITVVCLWKFEQIYEIPYKLPEVAFISFSVFILVYERFSNSRLKNWRKEGEGLSKKIKLKSLVVFPSNMLKSNEKEFELHLRPHSIKEGLSLRKSDRNSNLKKLRSAFTKDFQKLHEWSTLEGNEMLIYTTTHGSLAHIWEIAAKNYFHFEKMKKLDPYVEMNYFQWVIASFSTTGKINWRRPRKWDSYILIPKNINQ